MHDVFRITPGTWMRGRVECSKIVCGVVKVVIETKFSFVANHKFAQSK